jgi:hypothetical protein
MQHIGSRQWLAVEETSGLRTSAALFLAVAFTGLSLATGAASVSVTALAIRQAVIPGSPMAPNASSIAQLERWSATRFVTVAHRDSRATPATRFATARRSPDASVQVEGTGLDPNVPVAEAVKARGLLAALLSLEAEGDSTQSSEGLESIASPAALAVALSGAGPHALNSETSGLTPRKAGDRLLAAPGVEAAVDGAREASLQIPETPARKSLNPAGSAFSS